MSCCKEGDIFVNLKYSTRNLTVVVNCRRVANKIDEFAGLIESMKADIVFRKEAWLIQSTSYREVLPVSFNVYRNDRARTGREVFLLVHSSLRSSGLDIRHHDVESFWWTTTLTGNTKFIAGTFYRPRNADRAMLQHLYNIISKTSHHLIDAGDFDLLNFT